MQTSRYPLRAAAIVSWRTTNRLANHFPSSHQVAQNECQYANQRPKFSGAKNSKLSPKFRHFSKFSPKNISKNFTNSSENFWKIPKMPTTIQQNFINYVNDSEFNQETCNTKKKRGENSTPADGLVNIRRSAPSFLSVGAGPPAG